jgi:rubrerythrin
MALELADIFRQYGSAYRQKYAARLLSSHRRTMTAIERCRTEALGGQVYSCSACGEVRYSYHSCRNRHCPKCQHEQAQEWLQLQQELLLRVPYFLLTFTLPAQLRIFASRNQKLFYNTLFRASAQAVQILARDPRFIGGQIGLVGVLHTWTRNLAYHPHVHYLVPGGGLGPNSQSWLKARNNFFLPVSALSRLFRARFQHLLCQTSIFPQIPSDVWHLDWVVHCKGVGNGQTALKYLAPYVYRVAIRNRRLIKMVDTGHMESSQITFQYRDSKTQKLKLCTLSAEKFIHRFLQHVLPRGFVKIRYFGFFGAALRPRLLSLRQQLEQDSSIQQSRSQPETDSERIPSQVPHSVWLCPKCGRPMLFLRALSPNPCCSS